MSAGRVLFLERRKLRIVTMSGFLAVNNNRRKSMKSTFFSYICVREFSRGRYHEKNNAILKTSVF